MINVAARAFDTSSLTSLLACKRNSDLIILLHSVPFIWHNELFFYDLRVLVNAAILGLPDVSC